MEHVIMETSNITDRGLFLEIPAKHSAVVLAKLFWFAKAFGY